MKINKFIMLFVGLVFVANYVGCSNTSPVSPTQVTTPQYRPIMSRVVNNVWTEIQDNQVLTLRRGFVSVFSMAGSRAPSGNLARQLWTVYDGSSYFSIEDSVLRYNFPVITTAAYVSLKCFGSTNTNTSDTASIRRYFTIQDSIPGGGTGGLDLSLYSSAIMPSGQRAYTENFPPERMSNGMISDPNMRTYEGLWVPMISPSLVNGYWQGIIYAYDNEVKHVNYGSPSTGAWSLATAFTNNNNVSVPRSIYHTGQVENFYSLRLWQGNQYTVTTTFTPIRYGFGDTVMGFAFHHDSMFVYTRIASVENPNPQSSPWLQDNLFNGQAVSRPVGSSGWGVKSYHISLLSAPPGGIIALLFGIGDKTVALNRIQNTAFWNYNYGKLCFQVVLPRPGVPGSIIAISADEWGKEKYVQFKEDGSSRILTLEDALQILKKDKPDWKSTQVK